MSYLYQTVSFRVEQLEDLLEVLHLVLSEALILRRHINLKVKTHFCPSVRPTAVPPLLETESD